MREELVFNIWLDPETHEYALEPKGTKPPMTVTVQPYGASLIFKEITQPNALIPCPISPNGVPEVCPNCLAALCEAAWSLVKQGRDEDLRAASTPIPEPRQ